MSDGLAAANDREVALSRPLLKQKVLGGALVSAMASSSVKRCQESRHNQLALYILPRLEAFQRILQISFLAAISARGPSAAAPLVGAWAEAQGAGRLSC